MADVRRKVTGALRAKPIGVVRAPIADPADLPPPAFAPRGYFARSKGRIEIFPEFAAGLDGLEGFSHIIVLFHFHKAGPAKLKVVPPGQTRPRGVFATRSPHRPNAIGLSVLRLLRRNDSALEVAGLDLVDGTPVLDIKPYTSRDRKSHIRTGWLRNTKPPAR